MNKILGWIVGLVVVVLIIGGVWWGMRGSQPVATGGPDQTASTTPDTGALPPAVTSRTGSTTAEVIASLGDTAQYAALLSASGIGSTLSGKGPYTVFVSTDAGFGLLAPGTVSGMSAAQKKRMVQYSIVSGKALDISAQNSGTVTTLSGDALNFHVGSTGLVQANSSYALEEYKTKNGIIYVINQPLLPPQKSTY